MTTHNRRLLWAKKRRIDMAGKGSIESRIDAAVDDVTRGMSPEELRDAADACEEKADKLREQAEDEEDDLLAGDDDDDGDVDD